MPDLRAQIVAYCDRHPDPQLIIDGHGRALFANEPARSLIDHDQRLPLDDGFPEIDRWEITLGQNQSTFEVTLVSIDWRGERAWHASLRDVSPIRHALQGQRELAHQLASANRKLERANRRLEELATVDGLTGVLNRRGLKRVLSKELHRAKREQSSLAAMLIDLDDFRSLNQSFGFAVGDSMVQEVVHRIEESLRRTDVVGRLGNDEFLVLLPSTALPQATMVAERTRFSIGRRPILHTPEPICLTASVGLVVIEDLATSLEELLTLAHHAVRVSKKEGKNRTFRSAGAGRAEPVTPVDLSTTLQGLVGGTNLAVVGQPIVRLSDQRVDSHELLIRGPIGPFERPTDIFRLAREMNALTSIDVACLRCCARTLSASGQPGRYHVNVYPSTLIELSTEQLLEILDTGNPNIRICLELSEQQFIGHPPVLVEQIRRLQRAGIEIAIDDLGAGRGTMDSVLLLEPTLVKLDRDIVQGIATVPAKRRMLSRLAHLAQALELEIVAEGIETTDDAAVLRDLGIAFGQGYLWSKPVSIEQLGLIDS